MEDGKKRALEPAGARMRCAFSSLSTGEFNFDAEKAARVLYKVVQRFSKQWEAECIQVLLVETVFSALWNALKKLQIENESFKICSGKLVDQKAFAIGFGCIQRLAKPGESRNNVELHRTFNKQSPHKSFSQLVEEQLGEGVMAKPREAYVLTVPANHPLRLTNGVAYIINVLGPNMNPQKENALTDIDSAETELETAYIRLFEAFSSVVAQNKHAKQQSKSKKARITRAFEWHWQEINPVGLGTLPLGVMYPDPSKRPSKAVAMELLHKALDLGVQFFDTADTYGKDQHDLHYCETLLAEALQSYQGEADVERVILATKTGMMRTGSASSSWRMPKVTPALVRQSIQASHRALGGSLPIDLWQLHHLPPTFPELKSVLEEVKRCQKEGLVYRVGLCNCTVEELKFAQTIVEVVSVQNEFSPWNTIAAKPEGTSKARRAMCGMLDYCMSKSIAFLPHGFLGGLKARDGRRDLEKDFAGLQPMSKELGASPHAIVLAWARRKWPCIVQIPGARSEAHVIDSQTSRTLDLTQRHIDELDAMFGLK